MKGGVLMLWVGLVVVMVLVFMLGWWIAQRLADWLGWL
jgi:hypothetical protein